MMQRPEAQIEAQREMRRQFARLWSQAETAVGAFVFSLVPSFHDAEDLIQQIAEETAGRFDEFDASRGPFEAWVIWLAKRRVIDHFRKVRRDRLVFDDAMVERFAAVHMRRASSPAAGGDMRAEALEHCIDQLTPRHREMLESRYVEDQSPMQIAERIGSTAGSVRVRLQRVRDALAECIRRYVAREAKS